MELLAGQSLAQSWRRVRPTHRGGAADRRSRSPTGCRRRTTPASSTAISSRQTSCCCAVDGTAGAARGDHRLRHRAVRRTGGHPPHPERRAGRYARIHGARAGRSGSRHPGDRHLRVRPHPVRDVEQAPALRIGGARALATVLKRRHEPPRPLQRGPSGRATRAGRRRSTAASNAIPPAASSAGATSSPRSRGQRLRHPPARGEADAAHRTASPRNCQGRKASMPAPTVTSRDRGPTRRRHGRCCT